MPRNRELHEITRDRFWQLEDYLKTAEGQEKFGEVKVDYYGDDRVYRTNQGTILSSRNGYYAHHTLEAAAGK